MENMVDSGNIIWRISFVYEATNTRMQIHTQNMIYLLTAIEVDNKICNEHITYHYGVSA